jgi:hypothetical protein
MVEKKLDFTPNERELIEEKFMEYMQTVQLVARLHGLKGAGMIGVKIADDRSGLIVPGLKTLE